MKILFVMRHPAALRSLTSVLRLLDERGGHVHLVFGRVKPQAHKVLQAFAAECRTLTFGSLPGRGSPGWTPAAAGWDLLARRLRVDADYLRYLEPAYAQAPALRARAEAKSHPLVRGTARAVRAAGPGGARALRRVLEALDACLEPPPHVQRFLADFAPDAVVVTHLARDSVQADFVRAAKRLGIHTAYPVFSWDNLTNKGLVHELPEVVLVWNELQANEATELHGIPRERVRVLGAWSYDHWFDWEPSRTRSEFCAQLGLSPDRPLVLYVCSSGFVARHEVEFVRGWLAALRARDVPLADAGVIVRPHPRNAGQWAAAALDDPHAVVWPRLGEEPLEVVSRRNYFDSIHHAAAVVGINTSAQIESAIVGRPVHTILADEFRETQQGTLHFQYLKAEEFGHLHVGRTMDEHLDQLAVSVRGRPEDGRNERFLRRFVRPLGLDIPASPLYVGALEELVAGPAASRGPAPLAAPLVRRALAPVAARASRRAARRREEARTVAEPDELSAVLRRLRRQQGVPVLAAPWLGGELGEVLSWIPFLRWCQSSTLGLRDRLVVVARGASLPWYDGVAAKQSAVETLVPPPELAALTASFPEIGPALCTRIAEGVGTEAELVLLPSLVERSTVQAAGSGGVGLDFAPLRAPELPAGVHLPDDFVAVSSGGEGAEVAAALAKRGPALDLDRLERPVQTAALARARGFVGPFGVEAALALLLGKPAVVVGGAGDPDGLELASSFLSEPPFGSLHVLDAEEPAGAADHALRLLGATVGAPV